MRAPDLAEILGRILPVEVEEDGALTLRHEGTFASVRTIGVADGLELISLNQLLARDLPCDDELRAHVAAQANATMLGTVTLAEHPGGRADVLLRYNFPYGGLGERALQTLVLLVLEAGAAARRSLAG